jgi:hypothetical protein
MTFPEATVALDCLETVPSVSPAPVIAVVAAAWVSPTTFGTVTIAGPPPPLPPPPLPLPPPPQATNTAMADAATPQRIIFEHSRYFIVFSCSSSGLSTKSDLFVHV